MNIVFRIISIINNSYGIYWYIVVIIYSNSMHTIIYSLLTCIIPSIKNIIIRFCRFSNIDHVNLRNLS